MNKRETYIDFITDQLILGNISRELILSKFVKKWQTSERTFDRYWKLANTAHSERMRAINEAKADKYTQKEIEAFEANILDRYELLEQASKIVKDEHERTNDRLKAIEVISKLQGYYAPKEINNNIKGKFDDWTDDEIRAEIKRLENI